MTAAKKSEDAAARDAVEGRTPDKDNTAKGPAAGQAPAGPHADPALVNPDATPGAGAVPPADPETQGGMDSTSS